MTFTLHIKIALTNGGNFQSLGLGPIVHIAQTLKVYNERGPDTYNIASAVFSPQVETYQCKCDRQHSGRFSVQRLIIVALGKMEVLWKTQSMLIHVTQIEHCLRVLL
jgi:hypothetical protein